MSRAGEFKAAGQPAAQRQPAHRAAGIAAGTGSVQSPGAGASIDRRVRKSQTSGPADSTAPSAPAPDGPRTVRRPRHPAPQAAGRCRFRGTDIPRPSRRHRRPPPRAAGAAGCRGCRAAAASAGPRLGVPPGFPPDARTPGPCWCSISGPVAKSASPRLLPAPAARSGRLRGKAIGPPTLAPAPAGRVRPAQAPPASERRRRRGRWPRGLNITTTETRASRAFIRCARNPRSAPPWPVTATPPPLHARCRSSIGRACRRQRRPAPTACDKGRSDRRGRRRSRPRKPACRRARRKSPHRPPRRCRCRREIAGGVITLVAGDAILGVAGSAVSTAPCIPAGPQMCRR